MNGERLHKIQASLERLKKVEEGPDNRAQAGRRLELKRGPAPKTSTKEAAGRKAAK